ncbi:MAG: hypothetical protein MJ016_02180 [Victivallaceae bacterium]|nr:hypothetical protein [Victivallaceae bacterium]
MLESTENKLIFIVEQRPDPDVFDFNIRFNSVADIHVAIPGTMTADVNLVRGVEFDVENKTSYDNGAKIYLHYGAGNLPALSAMIGKRVAVWRQVPERQETELPNRGLLPSAELEKQLDKIVMMVQQNDEVLSRCVRVSIASGVEPEQYMDEVMTKINLSVQSCVYSAESAAGSAASSAAVAAFVGNCMTEITGNPEYAEKAARSFYNVEQQYGAVLAAGTATLDAVRDGGVNAVTLAGQTAALAVQEQGRTEVESITGAGGTYTAAIARAEGTMTVYLAGCSAAAANADATAGEVAAMQQSVSTMHGLVVEALDQALEAGTACTVAAGSCSQYTATSLEALQQARACVTDASGYATSAGSSAQSALAKAGEAAASAAQAHAFELAAGTVAAQAGTSAAMSSITLHNARQDAHGGRITALETGKLSLSGGTITGNLHFSATSSMFFAGSGSVRAGGNASALILAGAASYDDGGSVRVYGNSYTTWAGAAGGVVLVCNGGTAESELRVFGDGLWYTGPSFSFPGGSFSATPTAPTPASGDNSTKLATTAFVKTAAAAAAAAAAADVAAVKTGRPVYKNRTNVSAEFVAVSGWTASTPGWLEILTPPDVSDEYHGDDGILYFALKSKGSSNHVTVAAIKPGGDENTYGAFVPVRVGDALICNLDEGSGQQPYQSDDLRGTKLYFVPEG